MSKRKLLCILVVCLTAFSFAGETEKKRAIAALEAQITDMQKQIGITTLTTRETNMRNARDAALAEVSRAKKEVENADREYQSALTNLRANPQSQVARTSVNISQQHLEEATANLRRREAQANSANELWQSADNELRRERLRLDELRNLKTRLEAGIISPEEVLQITPARFIPGQGEEIVTITVTDTIAITDTLTVVETIVETVFIETEFVDDSRFLLLSIRPELIIGPLGDGIMLLGGSIEAGVIMSNNIYLSGDLNISAFGLGGGANIGWCFNKSGFIKLISGATAGLYTTNQDVNFTRNGALLKSETIKNMHFGGIFAKLLGGRRSNFDLTYKFLFGNQKTPTMNNRDEIVFESGFAGRHSIGFGYTFKRKMRGE